MKTILALITAISLTACGGGDSLEETAAVLTPTAIVQSEPMLTAASSTELLANTDYSLLTADPLYKVPQAWTCKNYPRIAKACMFVPGEASLVSGPVGATMTARMAWPVSPQWVQSYIVPTTGTYTLTARVSKRVLNVNSVERPQQAIVIKDGLTTLLTIPHADIPLGGETTVSVPVTLTGGDHALFLSLAARTSYGSYGYVYGFRLVSIK